jgi:hypothetical protein
MPVSLFDVLLARLLPSRAQQTEDLSFLTHEEIRELLRMRAEVRLAREQARLFVSQHRSHAL